jgi:hypothetical protein
MLVQIESMTDEQIDIAVSDIIEGVGDGTSEHDFVMASEIYNSIFFSDMPPSFTKRACSALNQHFVNTNNFWVNRAQNEYV